jgi:hypothetical protein
MNECYDRLTFDSLTCSSDEHVQCGDSVERSAASFGSGSGTRCRANHQRVEPWNTEPGRAGRGDGPGPMAKRMLLTKLLPNYLLV